MLLDSLIDICDRWSLERFLGPQCTKREKAGACHVGIDFCWLAVRNDIGLKTQKLEELFGCGAQLVRASIIEPCIPRVLEVIKALQDRQLSNWEFLLQLALLEDRHYAEQTLQRMLRLDLTSEFLMWRDSCLIATFSRPSPVPLSKKSLGMLATKILTNQSLVFANDENRVSIRTFASGTAGTINPHDIEWPSLLDVKIKS